MRYSTSHIWQFEVYRRERVAGIKESGTYIFDTLLFEVDRRERVAGIKDLCVKQLNNKITKVNGRKY